MADKDRDQLLEPANLGFEDGDDQGLPKQWRGGGEGYSFQLDTEVAHGGSCSARLSSEVGEGQRFGSASQSIAADNYRGRRIRLRGYLKAESVRGRAGLWLRVDDSAGGVLSLQNMSDRPVVGSRDWTIRELLTEVPKEAATIRIGFLLAGAGTIWADDLELDDVGELGAGDEKARTLTPRGIENLIAFTKLLGYVRYFHPSDEAAATDWERFALAGVQAVEPASSSDELIATLQKLFSAVAQSARVFRHGETPNITNELDRPDSPREVIAWRHFGVGTGNEGSIYSSRRTTGNDPDPREFCGLTRSVPAEDLWGRKARFVASVRAKVKGSCRAGLWIRIDDAEGQSLASDNMDDRPIQSERWGEYEVTADIPEGAASITFGIALYGWGQVWMQAAHLETAVEPAEVSSSAHVTEFEESLTGWRHLLAYSEEGGYGVKEAIDTDSGTRTIHISRDPIEWPPLSPNTPLTIELTSEVSCLLPISLYLDAQKVSMDSSSSEPVRLSKPEGFVPSGNDRTTRLADVALAWNVFQHFYPYFDVLEVDWQGELEKALDKAARDTSAEDFLATLRFMVAALKDGHGNVVGPEKKTHRIPLQWDWVEGKLVVTHVLDGVTDVQRGDVVLRLNGADTTDALLAESAFVSAATDQWRRFKSLNAMRMVKNEQPIELEIERNGKEHLISILPVPSSVDQSITEPRPEKITEIRPGIYYVDISRIEDSDFLEALPLLESARGIVFDLRGYPRGSVLPIAHMITNPITCARWNVPIVTRPNREGMEFHFSNWPVEPEMPTLPNNRVFLTDGRAISYAETYLGIIEHYRLAEIVGEPTAGTNGNVNPFSLPGGYMVWWTGMKVLKHDGSQHHAVGILPTVPVNRTIQGIVNGRDEILEAAIALLEKRASRGKAQSDRIQEATPTASS